MNVSNQIYQNFINVLKNNDYDKTNVSYDEVKKLIKEECELITDEELNQLMSIFNKHDLFVFGRQAECTADIADFITENDNAFEWLWEQEYIDEDFYEDSSLEDDEKEPTYGITETKINDIVIINGYSEIGDDDSFVIYKKIEN